MMKNGHSSSRSSGNYGYELPYSLARDKLAKIKDIEEQCRKSGAQYLGPNEIVIDYLNQPYHISLADIRIWLENSEAEVPLKDRILILHYFIEAKGTPATGQLVTYKQLPGGVAYFSAFSQRAIKPFVSHFGEKPELLPEIAAKLGGYEAHRGDASVTINGFKYVPITWVLWKGDEEVAASGSVLFDSNISDYLSTEDVTVLSETIIWKLVKGISTAEPGDRSALSQ
jgi:hypothetical protein